LDWVKKNFALIVGQGVKNKGRQMATNGEDQNQPLKATWLGMCVLTTFLFVVVQAGTAVVVVFFHAYLSGNSGVLFTNEPSTYLYTENTISVFHMASFVAQLATLIVFFFLYHRICIKPMKNPGTVIDIKSRENRSPSGRKKTLRRRPFSLPPPSVVVWSVLTGVILCVFGNELVLVTEYFFPQIIAEYRDMMEQAGFHQGSIVLLAAILFAPISEELLCRGIVQHYAMKFSSRFWVANTVQALMFAIIHFNWVQGTYAFIIGLVLGWLRTRYQTIWAPIIVHFVFNIMALTQLGYLLSQIPDRLGFHLAILGLAIAAMVTLIAIIGRSGSPFKDTK
jgi:membrane protease YdiL (CAAX protease family)